ncbi:carbohydrate kinase family protein [Agrococcus sp. DT81.2]|uniref:carbohydrate kinase family protein n=1 Tax=Agrococcus sp. DT81.2 TaxID=3393414 RepID=UPI003CE54638
MRQGDAPAIVVIGDAALDRTIEIDPASAADEKRTVTNSRVELGGTGANIATQARRLGAAVELASTVGDDDEGSIIVQHLRAAGVGVRLVRSLPGASTRATIVLDDPRRVYVEPGVAGAVDVGPADLGQADLIVVSYAPALVPRLVAAGLGDRLMVGVEHWMVGDVALRAALLHVRWIVTNAEGRRALQAAGDLPRIRATVVATDGARLVRAFSGGEEVAAVEPPRVVAVDPTGAGDAFAGTLAHALAARTPLHLALRRASTAGALATTRIGAQAGQAEAAALPSA